MEISYTETVYSEILLAKYWMLTSAQISQTIENRLYDSIHLESSLLLVFLRCSTSDAYDIL